MTRVMGIVNVTPDSFSDGGMYQTPEEAVRRVRNAIAEGAAYVDLGGESTRPGATPLDWTDEWARLEPVFDRLGAVSDAALSVDTYHPETAERALAAGATVINCVRSESVPAMMRLLERAPESELVLPAVAGDLVPASMRSRVWLDPMIGFGTTREQDLSLLRSLRDLASRGRVLVGASRKRIVKRLTGEKVAGKDLAGNLTIAIWAASSGADVVRVHDVRETVQALRVFAALAADGELPPALPGVADLGAGHGGGAW